MKQSTYGMRGFEIIAAIERPTEAAALLRKAAELIRERGWGRGYSYGEEGEICLVRAIDLASGTQVVYGDERSQAAEDAIRLLSAVTGSPAVGSWNDDPSRTETGVFTAIDKAIEAVSQ